MSKPVSFPTFNDEKIGPEENCENEQGFDTLSPDERIVLNVGGIKYETYRSTLTAYPDTMLGRMFSPRNQEMLHPTNGNEYFFDRNGNTFRYIMEYYRTGQIVWRPPPETVILNHKTTSTVTTPQIPATSTTCTSPSSSRVGSRTLDAPTRQKFTNTPNRYVLPTTHQSQPQANSPQTIPLNPPFISLVELELELNYFQIPFPTNRIDMAHSAGGHLLDEFAVAIEELICAAIAKIIDRVAITFFRDGTEMECPAFTMGAERLREYSVNGYCIINYFYHDLKRYLEGLFPQMVFALQWGASYKSLTMSMNYLFTKSAIQKHSKIGQAEAAQGGSATEAQAAAQSNGASTGSLEQQ